MAEDAHPPGVFAMQRMRPLRYTDCMLTICRHCGDRFEQKRAGRTARYCSGRCRTAAHRGRSLPPAMTRRDTWTRRVGKSPATVTGAPASSTRPATWSSYAEVRASSVGDGYGIMLGGGLGCWDLDHCIDASGEVAGWARDLLARERPVWVERSLSGDGLHAFVRAPEGRGFRSGQTEFYSWARFIAVTGDRFDL